MYKISFSLLFVGLLGCTQAQPPSDIERIVTTLAADDMEGREAGTPGAKKAADFIAEEFRKAGLSYFDNLSTFQQPFQLIENKVTIEALQINDQPSQYKEIFIVANTPTIKVDRLEAVRTLRISAQDNFSQRFNTFKDTTGQWVVLVDPVHHATFKKYRTFFQRTQTSLGDSSTSRALVFLLEKAPIKTLQVTATNTLKKRNLQNVVGLLEGKSKPKDFIIFSAHYDHIGIQSQAVNGDRIANGADDDASGTTAVIALAKHYAQTKENECTLVFVAFTAEEIGGYGSQYFAQQVNPEKVITMLNFEMIGKLATFGQKSAFLTGFSMSNLGELLQKNLEGHDFQLHPDPYQNQNLFYRSDNATLARLGVPAHTLSTAPIDEDPYYHTVDDEVNTLDITNMTTVIEAIPIAIKSIVKGQEAPTRLPSE
ncbi:MAG: M20/M25/M40 family metallo-hydrolase [Thermonemataceae bacterium]